MIVASGRLIDGSFHVAITMWPAVWLREKVLLPKLAGDSKCMRLHQLQLLR